MSTPRKPAREPVGAPAAEMDRPVARELQRPLAPGEFLSRDGEIISLKRNSSPDIFELPDDLKDPAWTREWKRYTTYNAHQTTHQQHLYENGWRPVMVEPGNAWAKFYGAPDGSSGDYRGPVRREDMILMERPAAMTEQVRRMDQMRADQQMSQSTERYNSRTSNSVPLPAGFTMNNPNLPVGVKSRTEVGPAQAAHQLAID